MLRQPGDHGADQITALLWCADPTHSQPPSNPITAMSAIPAASPSPVAADSASATAARVGLTGAAATAALSELDWRMLRWQHQLKGDLAERPKQTGFRVFAIILYKPAPPPKRDYGDLTPVSTPHPFDTHLYVDGTNQELAYMLGTNTEPCHIGSSICAERTALLQMRLKSYTSISKLYITADSDTIITPGLLCREMLCEFLTPDTPIVLASKNPQWENGFEVQVATLRQLFPYPSIFLNIPGSTVADFAGKFHSHAEKFSQLFAGKQEWLKLYTEVVAATAHDRRPGLHPIRYAAGVLFSDSSSKVTATTKLLEFGWTLDAVVKLVPYLEDAKAAGKQPELILFADQFGNLHSPSSPARSHLTEYGYTPQLVFHDREGRIVQLKPRDLAPDVPDAIENTLPQTIKSSTASAKGELSPHAH